MVQLARGAADGEDRNEGESAGAQAVESPLSSTSVAEGPAVAAEATAPPPASDFAMLFEAIDRAGQEEVQPKQATNNADNQPTSQPTNQPTNQPPPQTISKPPPSPSSGQALEFAASLRSRSCLTKLGRSSKSHSRALRRKLAILMALVPGTPLIFIENRSVSL